MTACLLQAVQAASIDGIWTGHDWIDTVNSMQDTDGVLTALTPDLQRKMASA